MNLFRHTLAAFIVMAPAAFAQIAPTMPAPTSPNIPTRVAPSAGPKPGASAVAAAVAAPGKIDINAASESEIATLPGIGPVTAKAIVDGRPWDDVAALQTKKVVARTVFERNKDRFALANINTSSADAMAKTLPGIGDKTAPKIVEGRPYATPQDLVTKKVLTANQLAKIRTVIAY